MSEHSDHNEGQKAGANSDFFDQLAEALNPFTSPEFKQGFWHGVEQQNQAQDD